jgi:hypothetical protein
MMWPAACPKCTGDLVRRQNEYGWERVCAECQHHDVAPMLRIPRAARRRAPLLVRVPARIAQSGMGIVHLRRAA